jgi:hypothetical protein
MLFISKSPLTPLFKGGNLKSPFIKGGFRGIFFTGFNLTLTFPWGLRKAE